MTMKTGLILMTFDLSHLSKHAQKYRRLLIALIFMKPRAIISFRSRSRDFAFLKTCFGFAGRRIGLSLSCTI